MLNFDEVKSVLKAVIIARKGGVPLDEIEEEFQRHTGVNIPYLSLGFTCLYDMMRQIKEIITIRNEENRVVYVTLPDKRTDHISFLVSRQKDTTKSYKESHQSSTRKQRLETQFKPYTRKVLNRSTPFCFGSDGEHSDGDLMEYNSVIISDPPKDMSRIHEPLINGLQMIGDDFFLQIAIRNLHQPIWRKKPCSPLHCGLCVSGMTIRGCIKSLKSVKSLSNKLVILLGAEDVYRGRTVDQMKEDFEELLDVLHTCFAFSKSAIKLCTIPPLANLNIYDHGNCLITYRAFNNYLYKLAYDNKYNLADFYRKMTNANSETEYEFFQLDARMVSGSSHPYVLFNRRGRRLATNILTSEKD
ncbi:uncharacterized protein osk [Chelonus insularis]|uniref:uncharacterized protein osk n=1 Tax=Chelonus insularis TaxID=460826 RepID=UPI00158E3471|nr:uncharacterized protein LOC118073910 [Chelonus insularis]